MPMRIVRTAGLAAGLFARTFSGHAVLFGESTIWTAIATRAPYLSPADTYPRQPGVDAIHYVFRVGLTDASNEITCETTMTVRLLRDLVGDLTLDLASPSAGAGMTVLSVRRGGPIETPGPASDAI